MAFLITFHVYKADLAHRNNEYMEYLCAHRVELSYSYLKLRIKKC